MNVLEFTKFIVGDTMYKVVDARRPGFLRKGDVLIEADINVVRKRYGLWEVVTAEAVRNSVIALYVK